MTSEECLQKGIAASHAGRTEEARDLLMRAVELDPNNESAWLWLGGVVATDEERLACLEEVLAINPGNATAQLGRDLLRARGVQAVSASALALSGPELEPLAVESLAPPQTPSPGLAAPEPSLTAGAAAEATPLPPGGRAARDRQDISPAAFWLTLAGLGLVFVCVVGLLLYQWLGPGIQLPGARPTDPPWVITDVLYQQYAAYNAEDIDGYMATMHSDTKDLAQMRAALADLLDKYDLSTRLYDVEVVKVTSREARVSFTLETRKVRGPVFRDNRVHGEFIMRKEDGAWKMYDQKVESVDYLE